MMVRACALGVAARRVGLAVLLAALPLALVVGFATAAWPSTPPGRRAIDLHTVWVGAGRYLHGNDPYPRSAGELIFAGPRQSFIQTPPVAALFAPVSVVRYSVVVRIMSALLALATVVALWLLGVRDWRCFGASFLSPAVLTSISIGTLTPLVMLALGVAWHWRNSTRVLAIALGTVVAAKLFVWPFLLWAWLTGRRGAAVGGAAVAIGLFVLSSVPLGMDAMPRYIRLLRRDGGVVGPLSYGLASLGSAGTILFILETVGVALIVVAAVAPARWRNREREIFVAAIVASLLLSPIIHLHYFALLVVVIAVLQPAFDWVWIAPAALWLTAQQDTNGDRWKTCVALAILGVVVVASLRRTTPVLARD